MAYRELQDRPGAKRIAAFMGVGTVLASCTSPSAPNQEVATVFASAPATSPMPAAEVRNPTEKLQIDLDLLGRNFDGKVGIAVRDVSDEWTTGFRAASIFPQQSVSKLWVALAVLDSADRGVLSLAESVTVSADDLTVFHQPIRALIGKEGYKTTLGELLRFALAKSDNTANDILLRRVGGPDAIRDILVTKQLEEIAFGPGERALQAQIASLQWIPEFSSGRSFWTARDALPKNQRRAALDSYLSMPADAATPDGIVRALAGLQQGELLSQVSTALMLKTMASSETGARRLRAGLREGWTLAHKTGTGQVLDMTSTSLNDVGLLSAPNGRTYAIAVMIARTDQPVARSQELMANVTRAIIANHEASEGSSASLSRGPRATAAAVNTP